MDAVKLLNCIFCTQDTHKIVFEENGITGKQCLACNLIYPAQRISFQDFFNQKMHARALCTERSTEALKRLYAKHHLSIIKQHVQHGNLLEIGSGFGQLVDEARLKGFTPHAIELNHQKADYLTNVLQIPNERRPLSCASFNGKQFNVIFHAQVLHELYDPLTDFEIMGTRLVNGGYTIFETPNCADIDARYFQYIMPFDYPTTQFWLSEQNIQTLLKTTGFELVTVYRYSLIPQLKFLQFVQHYFKISPLPHIIPPLNSNALSWWEHKKEQYRQFFLSSYFKWLSYLLYTTGARSPEPHAPQLIIYVARKR